MSRQNIEAALARNGLKPQSVTPGNDSVKVQLASVSFAGMLKWLDEMQTTALLSVSDAEFVAQAEAGMVNATLTLRRTGNE